MTRFAGQDVFVLTGAGISAESGIRTFRDGNGLWEEHRVEDVASPEGFQRDPKLVWRFYSERRRQALSCEPNAAHKSLAALEKQLGDNFYLATQNVDNLHEKAGSHSLVHMHGELFLTRCENERCRKSAPFADTRVYFDEPPRCPHCKSLWRPHIVWFGEVPLFMHEIKRRVQSCDVFLCIGSSGVVYPAAGLVRECIYRRNMGERVTTIYVGLERPDNADSFDEIVLGKAGDVLPALLR